MSHLKKTGKKEQVKTTSNRLQKVIKSGVQINNIETTTTTQYKVSMNLRSPSLEIQTTLADPELNSLKGKREVTLGNTMKHTKEIRKMIREHFKNTYSVKLESLLRK